MTDAKIEVYPITGTIGAEVRGVDLADGLAATQVATVREALSEYGVVFLRDQGKDPKRHLSLAKALGEIKPPVAAIESLADAGYPEIGVISTENGTSQSSAHWHTDVTWGPMPPKYSILHMQLVPEVGGDTTWASQYASYEALSPAMQAFLASLTAHHTYPGQPELSADHPVVIQNPDTRRRAMFVNALYTERINELSSSESQALLTALASQSSRPENCCRWRWTEGDMAIWDNHFVQHYAVGDYQWAPRKIHRIEIAGKPPLAATNQTSDAEPPTANS